MAWPGKTCNERRKGLSREKIKRQFQYLQELKDLPSKVELVLCSLAGLSSFVGAYKKNCSWGQSNICDLKGI